MLNVTTMVEFTVARINALLRGLVAENVEILREQPELALRLRSVRYRREPIGENRWKTIDQLVDDGEGDCEDLAAAWAAVAWMAGAEDAAAVAVEQPRERVFPFRRVMHILTTAWGRTWDPSKAALRAEAAARGVRL